MLLPRNHQSDLRGLGPPEAHRGGCTAWLPQAGRSEAGHDPGAPGRLRTRARARVRRAAPIAPRAPSDPGMGLGDGGRPQQPQRTARDRRVPTRRPRGPLPAPRRRSPGPSLPLQARLRRGSDSARGSSMGSPRAARTFTGAQKRRAGSTAQAWRPRPWRSGGGADSAVTQGIPLAISQ